MSRPPEHAASTSRARTRSVALSLPALPCVDSALTLAQQLPFLSRSLVRFPLPRAHLFSSLMSPRTVSHRRPFHGSPRSLLCFQVRIADLFCEQPQRREGPATVLNSAAVHAQPSVRPLYA